MPSRRRGSPTIGQANAFKRSVRGLCQVDRLLATRRYIEQWEDAEGLLRDISRQMELEWDRTFLPKEHQ